MEIKEAINGIESWANEDQFRFLNRVAWNTTVGIRSIISNNNLTSEEKLEAIRWLNEFNHTTNEHHFLVNHSSSAKETINSFIKNVFFFSSKNKNTKVEIIEILNLSIESVKNHRNFKS